jgi:formate hydrogenlyase subunit 6/NADH:ubiquinone oxidoreductase subunit I
MTYFKNIIQAIRTIAAGMKVTLPYFYARTVTVQYPDVAPTTKPRTRGFHSYQIERCIACNACVMSCPADCISVEKTSVRKLDKTRDIAVGGAISKFSIDYNTCLFCGLCTEVCPTQCLSMGSIHDHSVYDRSDLLVDFVELAKEGRRTVEPIWLRRIKLPVWAEKLRDYWKNLDADKRQQIAGAIDPAYCQKLAEALGKDGAA